MDFRKGQKVIVASKLGVPLKETKYFTNGWSYPELVKMIKRSGLAEMYFSRAEIGHFEGKGYECVLSTHSGAGGGDYFNFSDIVNNKGSQMLAKIKDKILGGRDDEG